MSTKFLDLTGLKHFYDTYVKTKLNIAGGTMTGNLILNGNPTTNLQAATKQYTDTKASLISPAFTGIPTAPTAAAGTNTTQIATMAAVKAAMDSINLSSYAPLNSPAFTGTPEAPTAQDGIVNNQLATNTYVVNAINYHMKSGYYTAPGTYGDTNPSSLTFTFAPKLIIILQYLGSVWGILFPTLSIGWIFTPDVEVLTYVNCINHTANWYSNVNATIQLNATGGTYSYFAIG